MTSPLRLWLHRKPHPATLRMQSGDGDERLVRIGESRSRWRDAEQAVAGASRVEALDDSGAILRVWENGDEGEAESERESVSAAPATTRLSELAQLGDLLLTAADRAAERHADAYKMAYEQQRLLVTVMSERLRMLEAAWHRLLMSQKPDVVYADGEAPPQPNVNDQMVAMLLGQALSGFLGSGGVTPPIQPNGAPKS